MSARFELIRAALTGFVTNTKMVEPDQHEVERIAQFSIMLADAVMRELREERESQE